MNPDGGNEKPEVVAPGVNIVGIGLDGNPVTDPNLNSGTSVSAPQVAGLAALLIDRNWDLNTWPEAGRAIIMASATHNVTGPSGIPAGEDLRDGAGGINAALADTVAQTRNWSATDPCLGSCWWGLGINNDSFPPGSLLYRYFGGVVQGELVRVAISWWSHPDCPSVANCSYDQLDTDLQLGVQYLDGGTWVWVLGSWSASWNNSYELVEFVAAKSGSYRIAVYKDHSYEGSNFLGIALARQPLVYLPLVFKGCSMAVRNGNFEAGLPPWVQQGTQVVCDWENPNSNCGHYIPDGAFSGTWSAWLAGFNNANDVVYQEVTVPENLLSARLSFWRRISTDETRGPYDYLHIQLRGTSGGLIAEVLTLTDRSQPYNSWQFESVDIYSYLASHEGESVRIYFWGQTDYALPTSFFVDDVGLDLCTDVTGQSGSLAAPPPLPESGYPAPAREEPLPLAPAPPEGYPPPLTPTPGPTPPPPVKPSPVTSGVHDLPAYSPRSFIVSWSGEAPSGIADYDLQVCTLNCTSPHDAAWIDWLVHTTSTSASFTGSHGQTYYFRCRARDNAGNLGAYPDTADTLTTVDGQPPNTAVDPLPTYTTSPSFLVRWQGSDDLSGLDHYDIFYRDESAGNWVLWLQGVTTAQATFTGARGHTCHFCSRGVDRVGNQEVCPQSSPGGWPIQSDARIGVVPWSRVSDLPSSTTQRTFTVSWRGSPDV